MMRVRGPDPDRHRGRRLAVFWCLGILACGGPKPHAARHSSYVPPGLRLSDATRLIVLGDSIGVGRGASSSGLAYAYQLQANDAATRPQELATVYDPTDGVGQASQCFFGLPVTDFVRVLDAWRDRYMGLGAEERVAIIDALGAFRGHNELRRLFFEAIDGRYIATP
jgi:hypothetical protein